MWEVNPPFVNLNTRCLDGVLDRRRKSFDRSTMSCISRILSSSMDHGDVRNTDVNDYRHSDKDYKVMSFRMSSNTLCLLFIFILSLKFKTCFVKINNTSHILSSFLWSFERIDTWWRLRWRGWYTSPIMWSTGWATPITGRTNINITISRFINEKIKKINNKTITRTSICKLIRICVD